MNYWKKYLCDYTTITGFDKDIMQGKVSWRNTPCLLMQADISVGDYMLTIKGEGEYWQSDTYESVFPGNNIRTARRIQRKLVPADLLILKQETENRCILSVTNDTNVSIAGDIIFVDSHYYNKWLTLEYNLRKQKVIFNILDDRI